jgi:predicted  nucleic acid-binding Zn-ribbon protein
MRKEKHHHFNSSVEDIFNDFVTFDGDTIILKPSVNPIFIDIVEKIVKKEVKVLYTTPNMICEFCNIKMWSNGTNTHLINKNREIKKQKYICPKCGHSHVTQLTFVPKGCNYTTDVQNEGLKQGLIEYKSLEKTAETIQNTHGCKPSIQTILNHMNKNEDIYLLNMEKKIEREIEEQNIDFSGVYNYDEQYVHIGGELNLRLTLLDNETKMVIEDDIIHWSQFNKKTVKKFIQNNLENLPLKGIVTDGVNYYPEIIDELKVPHQQCTFHKMQNLMTPLNKIINKNKLKIKKRKEKQDKIEKQIQNLEKKKGQVKKGRINKNDKKRIKTHTQIKELKKELQAVKKEMKEFKKENKELKKYIKQISRIFKSKTTQTAKNRLQKFKEKIKDLPNEIKLFIEKLPKNFQRLINHIENKLIPSTNNNIELFYGITIPKQLKRKYKTTKGFKTRLRLSKIRWNQRNVLKKNHIKKK